MNLSDRCLRCRHPKAPHEHLHIGTYCSVADCPCRVYVDPRRALAAALVGLSVLAWAVGRR